MLGRTTPFTRADPELLESVTSSRDGEIKRRRYSDPPVYHRVEEMLLAGDPRGLHAARVTREWEHAGLLNRPDIGRRSSWRRARGSLSKTTPDLAGSPMKKTPTRFNAAAVVRELNARFDAAAVVRRLNARFNRPPPTRELGTRSPALKRQALKKALAEDALLFKQGVCGKDGAPLNLKAALRVSEKIRRGTSGHVNTDRVIVLNMGLGKDSMTMLALLAEGKLRAEGHPVRPQDLDAIVFADVRLAQQQEIIRIRIADGSLDRLTTNDASQRHPAVNDVGIYWVDERYTATASGDRVAPPALTHRLYRR